MAKADNRLHFRCKCGEKVEAFWKSKFPFGKKQWLAEKCRVCRTVTDLSGIEVIPCPHCKSITIKGEKFCMECNQPLDVTIETLPIVCPNKDCELTIYLPRNYKGDYVCRFCEKNITEDEIRRQMKGHGADPKPAQLIELPALPEMEGRIIHKVEGTQFPYGSRLQVYEGTYGLLMQNGVCQYPLNPGTHLLSDSKLSKTALLDAAMQGEEVVFNTEIFCVVKKLPELEHQLESTPIRAKPVGDAPAQEYTVTAKGKIRCQVDDAKAFVSHIGFKAMTAAEFKADKSWMHTRTKTLLSATFDKAAHDAFEVYDASRSQYAYKAELTRLIEAKVASLLAEDGLYLDDIDLLEIAITETEDSEKKQQAHKSKTDKIETVKLPDVQAMQKDQLVIYQHDKDEFEYKSRVQVSEGTYGLLLQNGACQAPLMPGSHLLADCALEGSKRYDAAMSGENVVFYSSLYSVSKALPTFEWYHPATFIDLAREGDAPAKEYTIRAEGTIRFQVDDAKAFASQVGFRKLTVAELCHAYRPRGQMPALNAELEKDYPAENKDGWLYIRVKSIMNTVFDGICQAVFGDKLDTRRMSMYRLDFIKRLQAEFNAQLYGTGLSVTTLDLSLFTAEETAQSKQKAVDYQNDVDSKKAKAEQQSKTREALLKAAKTQFSWEARDVELHLQDNLALKAYASFRGDCRLQVVDEERFFDLPEVQKQFDAHTPDLIRPFFQNRLQTMIENHLAHFAQEFIDQGKIADPLDRYAYRRVADYVLDEIDHDLSRDGMKIHDLNISIPDSITPSKALKDYLAISDKKEKIRGYAESKLMLKTDPILVHMKGDPTVYVKAVFSGTAYLRVADADAFFETSEVKGFLASEPFVSESAVNAYYAERINPLFADIIPRIVQAIVDQTNADIRELHRLSGLLQSNVLNNMNERVSSFGMRLDSLDMRMPAETERSEIMLTWVEKHEIQSGLALQQEIRKLENDHTVFVYSENNRVEIANAQSDSDKQHKLDDIEIAKLDSSDRVEEKKVELAEKEAARSKRVADRVFQEEMDRIRKQDALGRLVDELAADRKEFSFDELRKEYERKHVLRELEINQAIREAQIRQQAEFDAQTREDRAKFDRVLNDAENKRILGDILRKIDESDLDWRKKLDEYARLQRKINVDDQIEQDLKIAQGQAQKDTVQTKTQTELDKMRTQAQNEQNLSTAKTRAEADQVLAAADQMIKREANETFLLVGGAKIKLADAEAELLEKISRYSEDRRKRILDSEADRAERKAILDFEQRMRDRQEQVAQEMEKLQQKYEHELAIRDRDDKLSVLDYEHRKLMFIVNHLAHEMNVKADVDKARIHADEEIRKAEAQYKAQHEKDQLQAEENRWKERLRYDEEMAKHAEAYQKTMADIQLAIEKIRNETERNKDDNQAKVAIAQAENADKHAMEDVKRSMERLNDRMDKRYRELQKAMDRIANSHKDLKAKVRDLTKAQQTPPQQTPQQPNVWQPPQTPQGGKQPLDPKNYYGYNQDLTNNIALTGGLGQDATLGLLDSLLGLTGIEPKEKEAPAAAAEPMISKPAQSSPQEKNSTAPVAEPASNKPAQSSFGAQPGMRTQLCPSCGKFCSVLATSCEHCGESL